MDCFSQSVDTSKNLQDTRKSKIVSLSLLLNDSSFTVYLLSGGCQLEVFLLLHMGGQHRRWLVFVFVGVSDTTHAQGSQCSPVVAGLARCLKYSMPPEIALTSDIVHHQP